MSYDPKTKIIELDKVYLGGDVFYLTTKEKERFDEIDRKIREKEKIENEKIKKEEMAQKKQDIIIAIVGGILGIIWIIRVFNNPLGAIGYTLLYGIPIILFLKYISVMIEPFILNKHNKDKYMLCTKNDYWTVFWW